MAYVAHIFPSKKTFGDYMAYKNVIPTLSWLRAFIW